MPTRLPLVRRRCLLCGSERFRASGRFRINANHKLLDAWLLLLCTACDETAKVVVLERVTVRSIRPELLHRLHSNDLGLVAQLLRDPGVQHRNRLALDWTGAWRLETDGSDDPDVSVRFAARIPIRPVRLIAEGRGLSRSAVERLIAEGKLVSAVRLTGKLSSDFTFVLKG